MIFPVKADIIGLIKGLVQSLQPFASAHEVSLSFQSEISIKESVYYPQEIISSLTQLICRIITFTPQNYKVDVIILENEQHDNTLTTSIANSGVNLAAMSGINAGIVYPLISEGDENSSLFRLKIPLSEPDTHLRSTQLPIMDHSLIKPWYSEIRKRLTSHFSNPRHIENLARERNEQEGIFLTKVNAIIDHHLEQEGFSTEDLAKKVALSRTQLFRKLKELTQMAPGQYIRFVRLQKAKSLLENSELNVSEVAYRVGFVSNSHFSRAFHRQFGINPSALK